MPEGREGVNKEEPRMNADDGRELPASVVWGGASVTPCHPPFFLIASPYWDFQHFGALHGKAALLAPIPQDLQCFVEAGSGPYGEKP
jgi:hypothetical protein